MKGRQAVKILRKSGVVKYRQRTIEAADIRMAKAIRRIGRLSYYLTNMGNQSSNCVRAFKNLSIYIGDSFYACNSLFEVCSLLSAVNVNKKLMEM